MSRATAISQLYFTMHDNSSVEWCTSDFASNGCIDQKNYRDTTTGMGSAREEIQFNGYSSAFTNSWRVLSQIYGRSGALKSYLHAEILDYSLHVPSCLREGSAHADGNPRPMHFFVITKFDQHLSHCRRIDRTT
jgi:hypothetical protein